jgi:adenylyl- and sulfurtransferase ThiI
MPVGVEGKAVCLLENEKSAAACWLAMKRGCSIIPVAYSDFDLTGLQLFSPHLLELVKIKNLEETGKMAKAVVVNDTIDNVREHDTKLLILRPLIYYEEDEIKELIELCKRK